MAKVVMSSYIFCKILSIQARVTQEVFNTSGSYSLADLIMLWPLNIQKLNSYVNEANIVHKGSPIAQFPQKSAPKLTLPKIF